MWILILTIITTDGTHAQHVPGFATGPACSAAGDLWQRAVMASTSQRGIVPKVMVSAVCVPLADVPPAK